MAVDFEKLQPEFRAKVKEFMALCQKEKFPVLIYCGYRTFQEQAELFCQGRNKSEVGKKIFELERCYNRPDLAGLLMAVGPRTGARVTKAGPGQSLHNYGYAVDGAPLVGKNILWSTEGESGKRWREYGAMAESIGLEWAGSWREFREFPHLQARGVDWRVLIGDPVLN